MVLMEAVFLLVQMIPHLHGRVVSVPVCYCNCVTVQVPARNNFTTLSWGFWWMGPTTEFECLNGELVKAEKL